MINALDNLNNPNFYNVVSFLQEYIINVAMKSTLLQSAPRIILFVNSVPLWILIWILKVYFLSQISIFEPSLRIECTLFLHVDSYHLWEFIFLIKIITANKEDSVFILPRTFFPYRVVFDIESLLWHIKCAWEDCKDRKIRQKMRIKEFGYQGFNTVIRNFSSSQTCLSCSVNTILFQHPFFQHPFKTIMTNFLKRKRKKDIYSKWNPVTTLGGRGRCWYFPGHRICSLNAAPNH